MASSSTGRVALFSIRPEYATAILSGSKKVEFRRTALSPDVSHIVIYATAPVQRIVGTFEVAGVECAEPADLWSTYRSVGGIERDAYDGYFAGAESAYAIRVSRPRSLSEPVLLAELGLGLRPPQSYLYLRDEALDKASLWLARDLTWHSLPKDAAVGATGLLRRFLGLVQRLADQGVDEQAVGARHTTVRASAPVAAGSSSHTQDA